MEPLKPEEKERILNHSLAAPEELDDYERLLAERYMADPDLPLAPPEGEPASGMSGNASARDAAAARGVRVRRTLDQSQREERLATLHKRLFPRRPRRPRAVAKNTK
ncbi:MAG: hypothetical protein LC800_18425 [Acidobacteria bacterium]|nr:hypothetical protein [Acidobacteriota bacterium]